MASRDNRWWMDHQLWVELFAILNIGFMAVDIYLAHSVNQFRKTAEYIPLFFSLAAPVLLLIALSQRTRNPGIWRLFGFIVGWASILVGLAGVIFHLESHFFLERTIRSLTYSAPFAAPLAYVGLGFLLLMNRKVDPNSLEWAQWVLLFTLGGFFGNFVFSLTDHAGNGFFRTVEWVPVFASAFAVGFLLTPLLVPVSRRFADLCGMVLLLEGFVGVWGFFLHAQSNLHGPSNRLFDNFVYGAASLFHGREGYLE